MLGELALELGNTSWSDRLHLINWYVFSRGGSLLNTALVVCRLCLIWALFHGSMEAPSTLGWIHLEDITWEYT